MGGRRGSISFSTAVLPLQSQLQGNQGPAQSPAAAAWTLPFTTTPCDGNPQCVSGSLQGKGLSERSGRDSPGRQGEPGEGGSDTPMRVLLPTHQRWRLLCPQPRKPEELCWQQPRRSMLWCLHALQTHLLTSNSSEIQTKPYGCKDTSPPDCTPERHPADVSPRAQPSPTARPLAPRQQNEIADFSPASGSRLEVSLLQPPHCTHGPLHSHPSQNVVVFLAVPSSAATLVPMLIAAPPAPRCYR